MPQKFEKMKLTIPSELKRNKKLSDQDKLDIVEIRRTTDLGYKKIADMFGVSKRRIQQICNPELEKKMRARFAELQKDGRFYDKEKHRTYMRNHRTYKNMLFQNGLLNQETALQD